MLDPCRRYLSQRGGLTMLAEPDPLPGDPSGYRPPSAADEGAFVPMIPINGLDEDTSDLFNRERLCQMCSGLLAGTRLNEARQSIDAKSLPGLSVGDAVHR